MKGTPGTTRYAYGIGSQNEQGWHMSRTVPFTVGDRFAGVARPDEVFVITGLEDKPGLPPLAERQLGGSGGPTLLGASALLDLSLRVLS